MRTLSLNLDLSDAEILRDAVAHHLRRQPSVSEPTLLDPHTQSLRATLRELNQMIERPTPRRRMQPPTADEPAISQLRRIR